MFGNKLINTNAGGGCTDTVDLYNPFPDGGGVALYQLNGNATDVSGNYDGTASNVTYGAGEFGQAGVFNGSSSQVVINSVASQISSSNTPFTISVWVKAAAIGSTMAAYEIGSWFTGTVRVIIHANGIINLSIKPGAAVDWNIETTTPLVAGVWTNITATYNGSYANLYINGVFSGTASGSKVMNNLIANIGSSQSTFFFNGSIDQFRIFNRALRPYEVAALYTEEYCTPTIVPSEHFNTVLYTAATANGTYDITGSSFQPDLIWVKNRDNVENHFLFDSVRGMTNMTDKFISSNRAVTEATASAAINGTTVTAIDGGFRVVETSINAGELYFNGRTYVSWNFKAGGAAVTNTDGTITSQVSANTEAGFSIVSFNGSTGSWTAGHGLNDAPKMVIYKNRDIGNAWSVWVEGFTDKDTLYLNLTNAKTSAGFTLHGSIPTSTTIGCSSWLANSGDRIIAYCFAEVEGFSNIGSYVGNGSTQSIVTGFEPAFIMIKPTSLADNWLMYDNKRGNDIALFANLSNADTSYVGRLSLNANGFTLSTSNSGWNQNGASYIYMAFAADPTTIEPSLEDSFNTVLYTGDGTSNRTISGYGFDPDFLWMKPRNFAYSNNLYDTVRGDGIRLVTNSTAGDQDIQYLKFTTDGFIEDGSRNNESGVNYVVWGWKGAEIPAINSNGSIKSVVSANPAAGFSIVSYTGAVTGANKTIGHGLNTAPAMVIVKDRDWGVPNWFIWHQGLSGGDYYLTFTTAAQTQNSTVFSAAPTDSVVNLGIDSGVGDRTDKYIAYCFAEVAGFSKFGSYSGTDASGNYVATGFEPAFVMIKRSGGGAGNWVMKDNKRNPTNPVTNNLYANLNNAANDVTTLSVDFNPLGFTVNGTSGDVNDAGTNNYIYMAFANQF